MLTSKERAGLRSLANGIETIFQIGKGGISETLVKEADAALEARELIKLRCLETCPLLPREACDELCEQLGAEGVQVIGTRFVMYRESKKNKGICRR